VARKGFFVVVFFNLYEEELVMANSSYSRNIAFEFQYGDWQSYLFYSRANGEILF
jgi:hypothetical protein